MIKLNKLVNVSKKLLKTGLCWTYFRKEKIKQDRIFIMTYDNSYSCNEKYIVEEILRRKLPLEIVWAYSGKKSLSTFPKQVRPVARGSLEMCICQITSKIWLDNALNCVWYYLPKRKGQIYINTWHGSMGIKRLSGNKNWMRRASICNKVTDYCITNSKFEEDVFRSTFWPDVTMLKYGHARNDVLFDKECYSSLREKVSNRLGISSKSKWMLYAPTFRDSGDLSFLDIDFNLVKQSLEDKFGGQWNILVRLHFKNRNKILTQNLGDWLVDASGYEDMQELMAVVDAGITDYSSWAYDYILTQRPLFLYTPDLESYDQQRGFYYPLESTPFSISKTNAELGNAIRDFDEDRYKKAVEKFLEDKGCYEKGQAAAQIVDFLETLLKEKCQ